MATGCGKVVIGGARATYAMSLHSISARMASRGAARKVHFIQMHPIAALTGSGGSTGTITRSLSARHSFLTVSFWRCLSLANAGSGNAKSANTTVCYAANANFADAAVRSADSGQSRSHVSSAKLSPAWWPCGDVACLPHCDVARWHRRPMLSPTRPSRGDVACQEWRHRARPPLRR